MPVPEFVRRLRAAVGHDVLWLSAVSAVVLDDHDRVLLNHRVDNGRWGLPGGILDPGEQPAVGLAREVAEETAVEVEVVALTSAIAGEVITHANGDRAQYLVLAFWCRPAGGTGDDARVADEESHAVRWVPLDEVPHPLSDGGSERLRYALAYRDAVRAGGTPTPWFAR